MLIYCPRHLREIYGEDGLYYTNRVVNLNHVSVLGKSYVNRNEMYSFYTIRFSHSKNHSTEWYFANKEDRDNVFEGIITNHVSVIN